MAQATIMTWNLGDLDMTRANRTGLAYVQYLASVMQAGNVALAGFCGIRSGLAGRLGDLLVKEMGNRIGSITDWNSLASPPLGLGRDEQYLFVWNMKALQSYAPDSKTYWVWEYPLPGDQQGLYGFPRPANASTDLPPFTMFFRLGGGPKFMPVALYHAPDWSPGTSQGVAIAAAFNNLAQIPVFDLGQGALIMGTFNVPANDDVTAGGSNGAVFSALAGESGKYTQVLNNQPNRLVDTAAVAISMEETLAQTSDNFFFRRNGLTNGIGYTTPLVANLFTAALGQLDENDGWVTAPLGLPLALMEWTAENQTAAGPDGSYMKLEDALAVYRRYFSGYLPMLLTLTF